MAKSKGARAKAKSKAEAMEADLFSVTVGYWRNFGGQEIGNLFVERNFKGDLIFARFKS